MNKKLSGLLFVSTLFIGFNLRSEPLQGYWVRKSAKFEYKGIARSIVLDCQKIRKRLTSVLYTLGARNIALKCYFTGRRYPKFFTSFSYDVLQLERPENLKPAIKIYKSRVEDGESKYCRFYSQLVEQFLPRLAFEEASITANCDGEKGRIDWSAEVLLPDHQD